MYPLPPPAFDGPGCATTILCLYWNYNVCLVQKHTACLVQITLQLLPYIMIVIWLKLLNLRLIKSQISWLRLQCHFIVFAIEYDYMIIKSLLKTKFGIKFFSILPPSRPVFEYATTPIDIAPLRWRVGRYPPVLVCYSVRWFALHLMPHKKNKIAQKLTWKA